MAEHIKIDTCTKDKFYDTKLRKFGLGELSEISANVKMGSNDDMISTLRKAVECDKGFDEICTGDLK